MHEPDLCLPQEQPTSEVPEGCRPLIFSNGQQAKSFGGAFNLTKLCWILFEAERESCLMNALRCLMQGHTSMTEQGHTEHRMFAFCK